ncbi:alkane 1-monooxygenase [Nocardioides mesophilus]|uniref:Alkane 1-monooxygenase n=1 Tax=Nocardioides mesophilus TaxID=433659 RepID=A0A7G9RFV8_9ACTN|nr:alkane 1-monooxygenase [Nocardioides mesophilus]QNN54483.1 alkane 1-monooxygenase [Nocardioides mesophilus]
MATSATVPPGSTEHWKDKKRYLWLLGLVVPSLAFLGWGLVALTGWSVFWFTGPIVVFGVVPVIDIVAGLDRSNPPDDLVEALEKDRYYRWITYLFLPIQYAALVWACWMFSQDSMSVVDKTGLALSIGTIAGIGINTAHELGHKKESHERWLAKIALAQSFYGHFYIEHNRGHHVRVATPEDPASSRVGESFYAFWPRTVLGSLRSAWGLERRRIMRRRPHPWTLDNDVLNAWLMSAVLWGGLVALFGVAILPFLVIQAVVGFSLLEAVNYLEHYGMRRNRTGADGTGRYERVDPSHSWNSNNIATNVLLYHLQRHSDHHANPTRRYQTLRDFEESPVLPTGYAGMILIALVPPLWRRVMDPRVIAHFGGDVTRANIQPSRREKVLSRYGAVADAPATSVPATSAATTSAPATSGTGAVA